MSELVKFQFHGDTLDVVQDGDRVWVSVRRVCEALNLNICAQQRRLKKQPWAVESMTALTGSDGKFYETFCIDLDTLPMWLATIETSRVRESIRPKLEAYQRECAKVLRNHFLGPKEVVPAAPQLGMEAANILLGAVNAVEALGTVPKDTVAVFRIKAAELATGFDLTMLLPPAGEQAAWLSPTQIAEKLGVTVFRVGRVITELGLRGDNEELARSIWNKAANSNKQVVSYVYSPRAVNQIAEAIRERAIAQVST